MDSYIPLIRETADTIKADLLEKAKLLQEWPTLNVGVKDEKVQERYSFCTGRIKRLEGILLDKDVVEHGDGDEVTHYVIFTPEGIFSASGCLFLTAYNEEDDDEAGTKDLPYWAYKGENAFNYINYGQNALFEIRRQIKENKTE